MATLCGTVDWTAAGSWFQGLAGFAGAAAVYFAASKGVQSLEQWRRQRQVERQIAVAERVMTLIYRTGDGFKAIRNPATFAGEISRADEALGSALEGASPAKRRLLNQAQVVVARLADQSDLWRELFDCLPVARAVLGVEVEGLLRRVWATRNTVNAHAYAYADSEGDQAFQRESQAIFWEYVGDSRPGGDRIAKELSDIVSDAERLLLPILKS